MLYLNVLINKMISKITSKKLKTNIINLLNSLKIFAKNLILLLRLQLDYFVSLFYFFNVAYINRNYFISNHSRNIMHLD